MAPAPRPTTQYIPSHLGSPRKLRVTAKAARTQPSAGAPIYPLQLQCQAAGDIVSRVTNSPIQVTSGAHDACVLRTMSTASTLDHWHGPSCTIAQGLLHPPLSMTSYSSMKIKQRRMYPDVASIDANNPRCRASARENDKAAPAIIQSVPIDPTAAPVDPPMTLF
ncbi:hypothetical protein N7501_003183 [Penicillium viridicatum]|nr:hypothetical protein N7501_003183 [Penicillium viridicatum]